MMQILIFSSAVEIQNLPVVYKPSLCGGRLPVRQQADGPTSLKITDDRAVALVAPPCPVIDANHFGRAYRRTARLRTTRNKVSLLTGSISRWAKRAAGRPPSANPR